MNQPGVWEKILSDIRAELREETFERWFGACTVKSEALTGLTVEVPSIFYRNWILEHYGASILERARLLCGPTAEFIIQIAGDNGETEPVPTKRRRRTSGTQPPVARRPNSNNGSKLNPKYTFDNFLEGSCNRLARAASLAAAQAPGRAYNPLFIYGGVGLGKTHLMQAIGHHMLSHSHGVRIHYVSSEAFTNHLITSLQTRSMNTFRRSYRDTNALLIDDIQFLSGKEQTQEEFFHTFNTLFDLRRQIVISSDRSPSELADMEARLVSRFQSGLVVDLQVPELETRVAILLRNASLLDIAVPEDVAFFLAEKIRSNIRNLEGALVRVAWYASVMKRPLTVGLAEYALRDVLLKQETQTVTIETIQKKVADFFDLRVADMKSCRRPKTIAFPRQVAMYLCRELTPYSLKEIGEAFGGRDHSTVIHAHNVIGEKMRRDKKLELLVSRLKEELTRP